MKIDAQELNRFLKKIKSKEINQIVISEKEGKLHTIARTGNDSYSRLGILAFSDFDFYLENEYGVDLKTITGFLTGKKDEVDIEFEELRINFETGKSRLSYHTINPQYVSSRVEFEEEVDLFSYLDSFRIKVHIDGDMKKDILSLLRSSEDDIVRFGNNSIFTGDENTNKVYYSLDIPLEKVVCVGKDVLIEAMSKSNQMIFKFNELATEMIVDLEDVFCIIEYVKD